MSKYFSFCNQRNSGSSSGKTKNQKGSNIAKRKRLNFGICFRFLIVLLIVFFALTNVLFINFSTTKGFELADLERQMSDLENQNKSLSEQVQELRSVVNVEQRAEEMEMVSVSSVEYLSVTGGVALKN